MRDLVASVAQMVENKANVEMIKSGGVSTPSLGQDCKNMQGVITDATHNMSRLESHIKLWTEE